MSLSNEKRWMKEARSHRQALKKAASARAPNLFVERLSRQNGMNRSPSGFPWLWIAILVVAGVGFWLWQERGTFFSPSNSVAAVPVTPPVALPASTTTVVDSTPTALSPVVTPSAVQAIGELTVDNREWHGDESAIHESRRVLIRSRTAWRNLWAEMGHPVESAPPINFNVFVVIAAFAGPQPQGSTIGIQAPQEKDDTVTVPVQLKMGAAAPQVSIYPWHIKIIPRTDKSIRIRTVGEPS